MLSLTIPLFCGRSIHTHFVWSDKVFDNAKTKTSFFNSFPGKKTLHWEVCWNSQTKTSKTPLFLIMMWKSIRDFGPCFFSPPRVIPNKRQRKEQGPGCERLSWHDTVCIETGQSIVVRPQDALCCHCCGFCEGSMTSHAETRSLKERAIGQCSPKQCLLVCGGSTITHNDLDRLSIVSRLSLTSVLYCAETDLLSVAADDYANPFFLHSPFHLAAKVPYYRYVSPAVTSSISTCSQRMCRNHNCNASKETSPWKWFRKVNISQKLQFVTRSVAWVSGTLKKLWKRKMSSRTTNNA